MNLHPGKYLKICAFMWGLEGKALSRIHFDDTEYSITPPFVPVHQWNLWAFRVLRMFLLRCFFCCCLFLFCFCLKPLLGCKFFGQKDLTYLIHLCITHSTDIYWAHYVPACNLMPAYHRSSINIKPNWNVVGDLTPKSSKAFQSGVTFRESLSSALKSLAGFYSWKNWTMISGFSFLLGTYITLLLGREFPFPFPQLQARRVA